MDSVTWTCIFATLFAIPFILFDARQNRKLIHNVKDKK